MSHSSPGEKLIYEVKGLIAELKREYFSKKDALNDDEILVHKLCVRLENVLRYGAREKYSFLGIRKDYWNYISESLPKDETVKFIQSIADFKTNQGKGRALLRYALMQKSLADTLQRSTMNNRITKDYYNNESVMRNDAYFQSLVHTLYDLNAVEFLLPHQGYDLDKSYPSFARKNFNPGSRNSSRRSSISSVQSFQADPLQSLRTNVGRIDMIVNAWLGKIAQNTDKDNNSEVSLLQLIDKLALIRENIILLKSRSNNEIEILKTDIEKLKEDKVKSEAYAEQRVNLVHDRYNSAANEKIKEVCEKLIATEMELTQLKASSDNSTTRTFLLESQQECKTIKSENKDLIELVEKYKIDVANLKENNYSSVSTNKILENKLTEIQKINDTLNSNIKEVTEKNQQLENMVTVKDTELSILQDSYEKSTSIVAGSFEQLKTELSSQHSRTSDVLNNVCITNEGFLNESKALTNTNSQFLLKIQVLEEKLLQEGNKKEEFEKIVADLKSKYTEDTRHQSELQKFIADVWNTLNIENNEYDFDGVDGGLMKPAKYNNMDTALQKLIVLQNDVNKLKKAKELADEEVIFVKNELTHITATWDDTQKKLNDAYDESMSVATQSEKKCKEFEEENKQMNLDVEAYNGKIYDMSVEIINLNQQLVKKEEDCQRGGNVISLLQNEVGVVKIEKEELLQSNDALSTDLTSYKKQLDELSEGKVMLSQQLENQSTKEISLLEEIDSLKKEVENVNLMTMHEVESLKFQLSTEEIKKENALKELTDANKQKTTVLGDLEVLTGRHRELQGELKELEGKHRELEGQLETEKDPSILEKLEEQCNNARSKYNVAEKEITFLKIELAKIAMEKEEEKTLRVDSLNQLNNMVEEKRIIEEKHGLLSQDLEDIKTLLVNSTKDKHELWQKKEQLDQELTVLRESTGERWVTDNAVNSCTDCKEQFTLTRRKHHCRLCGHIYCRDCSNRWVKNGQSRKKVRACNDCADMQKETQEKSERDSRDETISDINSTSDQASFFSTDEEAVEGERKVSEDITEENIDEASANENLTTGVFEILDPAEVSGAGSFGLTEQIILSSDDQWKSSLIPTTHVDDDLPVPLEKIEIDIPAGIRVILPVMVVGNTVDILWEFTSNPKDVGFGVAFKPSEEENIDNIQTLVPLSRYISHKLKIQGKITAVSQGVYYFLFDNSYSRLTTKKVICMVGLAKSKPS